MQKSYFRLIQGSLAHATDCPWQIVMSHSSALGLYPKLVTMLPWKCLFISISCCQKLPPWIQVRYHPKSAVGGKNSLQLAQMMTILLEAWTFCSLEQLPKSSMCKFNSIPELHESLYQRFTHCVAICKVQKPCISHSKFLFALSWTFENLNG